MSIQKAKLCSLQSSGEVGRRGEEDVRRRGSGIGSSGGEAVEPEGEEEEWPSSPVQNSRRDVAFDADLRKAAYVVL